MAAVATAPATCLCGQGLLQFDQHYFDPLDSVTLSVIDYSSMRHCSSLSHFGCKNCVHPFRASFTLVCHYLAAVCTHLLAGSLQHQLKLYHAVAQTGHDADIHVCQAADVSSSCNRHQPVQEYDTAVADLLLDFVDSILQHSLAATRGKFALDSCLECSPVFTSKSWGLKCCSDCISTAALHQDLAARIAGFSCHMQIDCTGWQCIIRCQIHSSWSSCLIGFTIMFKVLCASGRCEQSMCAVTLFRHRLAGSKCRSH